MTSRVHFQEELQELEASALAGLDLAVTAIDRTLDVIETADLTLGEMVIADDDVIDSLYMEVHDGILSLIARQAPVASDLRLVAALLHVIRHVERIGDQCVTISKLIRVGGPNPPAYEPILDRILRMAQLARAEVLQAKEAFAGRDVDLAYDLVQKDQQINELQRECFQLGLDIGDDIERREWAMHMTLVARAIERIGDYSVDIGEQIAFVVTGEFQEFSDASRPITR